MNQVYKVTNQLSKLLLFFKEFDIKAWAVQKIIFTENFLLVIAEKLLEQDIKRKDRLVLNYIWTSNLITKKLEIHYKFSSGLLIIAVHHQRAISRKSFENWPDSLYSLFFIEISPAPSSLLRIA